MPLLSSHSDHGSGIASVQRAWVILVWVAGGATAWSLADRPWVAAAAGFALLACHAWILGFEFLLLPALSAGDPAPRPGAVTLLTAWGAEALHAWRVFAWRQPFRWRSFPDRLAGEGVAGRRGVVLVHGFLCNRGFWMPWLHRLTADRRAFVAVNLAPPFASIDEYAPRLQEAVTRVRAVTGLPPLVVGHSMGGLAARAWLVLQAASGEPMADRVHRVVTIGSPHAGTWMARLSQARNGRQMRAGSEWLQRLEEAWRAGQAGLPPDRFICWYSNADNIVLPASSATLPGADNRLVLGAGHVALAFRPTVMNMTLGLLDSSR